MFALIAVHDAKAIIEKNGLVVTVCIDHTMCDTRPESIVRYAFAAGIFLLADGAAKANAIFDFAQTSTCIRWNDEPRVTRLAECIIHDRKSFGCVHNSIV